MYDYFPIYVPILHENDSIKLYLENIQVFFFLISHIIFLNFNIDFTFLSTWRENI